LRQQEFPCAVASDRRDLMKNRIFVVLFGTIAAAGVFFAELT
jgi:hypothetical protein